MKLRFVATCLLSVLLVSCQKPVQSPVDFFASTLVIEKKRAVIDEELLAKVEDIECNDSCMVVFDVHGGNCFSLFDLRTGELIRRFGAIGAEPDEIQLGTTGSLDGNQFNMFYSQTGFIGRYTLDSLYQQTHASLEVLTKYTIPDSYFSKIILLNDSLFLGAGVYQLQYQYAIFNNRNEVLDYTSEIFNTKDRDFNTLNVFLSNQGRLKKHPNQDKFVFSLNYSSNIDFYEVVDNKLHLIKSLRLRSPKLTPIQNELFITSMPDEDNALGYLSLATSEKYIYALYTDKKFVEKGKSSSRSSNIVLVYDWKGNPVRKYDLQEEAYYITVNEKNNCIYAAIRNEDEGWSIVSYSLKE